MTERHDEHREQVTDTAERSPPSHAHWVERCRARLKEGSWSRRRYDAVFLPIDPPTKFTAGHGELVAQLTPRLSDGSVDDERTSELLAEAQAIYVSADERIQGAERRATTGAVAIAVSLLLTGGGLLADSTAFRGNAWRWVLTLLLVAVVVCLVMSGLRALGATSRIHVVHRPSPENIVTRGARPLGEARVDLAAETLKDYGYNTKVADWKVALLGAAAWWFRWALGFVLALALAFGAYTVAAADTPDAAESPVARDGRG